MIDNQNPSENLDPPTNTENLSLNHESMNTCQQCDAWVGHTPSAGTHTHFSPFDENYGTEISPANALKELMRVKLENQVLIELFEEQVAANGLKVPAAIIP